MKKIKLNKFEKRKMQEERLKNNMGGTGIYIYENNTDADLSLPKPTASGSRTVGPRKRFQGDSYYMSWVGSPMNLLKLIEEVVPKTVPIHEQKEQIMSEKKLILDQPDTITTHGKTEQVVPESPIQQFNDTTNPEAKNAEVLLNESPIDGVQIILG